MPTTALAQQTQPIVLDTIYLDAGLTPIEQQAYGRANTVITGEELEASGVATVQDALRRVPGVAVSGSGESNTQVRIRGAEGNHTLVLVDGIRAMAGAQEYFFSGIPSANIERIEVLRGPQSVFFGADASAGVINIITDKGEPGTTARAGVEYGDGWSGYAHVSRRDDRGGVALSFSRRNDHGYDISGSRGGDDDGLRRSDMQLSADYALSDDIRAGVNLRRADQEYEHDAVSWPQTGPDGYLTDSNDRKERAERGGRIWLEADTLDGRLRHRLAYEQTRYEFDDFQWTQTEARTDILKYRGVYGLDGRVDDADHTIAFGLERRKDENSLATDQRRRSDSAIVEYRGAFTNGLDVQLGVRRDDNDVFKDATTWSLGLSYQLPNAPVRLHASAGTGVVNPDYAELFGAYGYVGNPDLQPEKNRGFDLGIEAELLAGRAVVDLTYFHEDLENEITWSLTKRPDGTNFFNQEGTSKRRGVEIAASYQATDDLTIGADYTYLHAKDPDGGVETRRPRHQFGLNATYLFAEGRGSLSGDLTYVAGNFDGYPGTRLPAPKIGPIPRELPDYTVVNVAAGYDVTDNVRLTGRVVNLFDAEYSDLWGYPARGRTAYLGLSTTW
ncbi:TonB-dependent receptor plug domain-containing protein [Paracoccus albus]|uniref:TonB-dependent receptor plug domain-containing protein n=1 Tax=Paracoccus albus TaxID=3017784 RepID=UPI0022F004BB|nr:TonB-dependent receptor [Paracoccus albus]WBU59835.1 TonB-dependent receptor [Paracoccus albus]